MLLPQDAGDDAEMQGAERVPTSVILENLRLSVPDSDVTVTWLIDALGTRSFGLLLLIMAIVGLMPGASVFMGILIAIPALQMVIGRVAPVLPRFIARRRLSTPRLVRILARVIPVLARMERYVRPRWQARFKAAKRVVGFAILLLAATLVVPVPFSHVIPALVILLIAFAFLEEDGVLLILGLVAAVLSLLVSAAAVWGIIEAGLLL
jgi:hypothetical protein